MGASQPLPIEEILEGKGLAKKLASLDLLSGLGARLTRASDLAPLTAPRDPIATTVPGVDRLLSGGLPRGGLVELSGRRSSGRFSIGLAALASATSSGEAAALVDLGGHLDPQSAEAAGADLTRLLWVRPARLKEAVASTEMLLSTGFPLVVADLGLAPMRGRTVPDAAWVRLERAARSHGAALLLLAPYRISGVAAGTVLAADTARAVWRGSGRSPRLLAGIASRLTLQKDLRARSGVTEPLSLSVGDDPLTLPSPPGGGRGDFSGPALLHLHAIIPSTSTSAVIPSISTSAVIPSISTSAVIPSTSTSAVIPSTSTSAVHPPSTSTSAVIPSGARDPRLDRYRLNRVGDPSSLRSSG